MPEELMNDFNVPDQNAQTLKSGEDVEGWLTANFGPAVEDAPWPPSLPAGLRWHDSRELDEKDIVVPSWNAIPRREVVRAGRTVAVIDTTECGVVRVVESVELPTQEDARIAHQRMFTRECAQACDDLQELPEALKVGALMPEDRERRVAKDSH
jgi:hypothetical protein